MTISFVHLLHTIQALVIYCDKLSAYWTDEVDVLYYWVMEIKQAKLVLQWKG